MIGLGDDVLTGWGDTRERHLEYASHVAHLYMVVYSSRSHNLSPTTLSDHLTVYPTRSTTRPGFIWDAHRIGAGICCQNPIDAITTQDPFSTGLPGVWLRRRFDAPLHVQSHSDFFGNPYWLAERPLRNALFSCLGRWVLHRADTFRVVNHAEKDKYIAMGIPPERIEVVPVPVRLERFTPDSLPGEADELRSRLDIPPDAPVLLWVGRPVITKAIPVLIDAFALVHSACPEVYLVLVGDFNRRPDIPRMVSAQGLVHWVRFPGRVDHADLPAYYRLATLYVHPSRYEGLGLTMIEASSCGTPVVATRSAGAQEIVIDGETGYLCAIDDPANLADRISHLLVNPELAVRYGQQAHTHVTRKFDRQQAIQKIIYEWQRTTGLRR